MKKVLVAGICALALTATGAMAQNAEGQGGQPSAKSGGMKPGKDMKAGGAMRNNNPNTTGMSKQDRATVPGSLNAGGTSQSSPNTTQPGASKQGK
ncbi:MAG: hypothetical protein AB7F72_12395 [Afipia sp.]